MFKKKEKHPELEHLYRVDFGRDSQPYIQILGVLKKTEKGYITDWVDSFHARIVGFDQVGKYWFTTPIEAIKVKIRELDEYAEDIRKIRNL